MSDENGLWIDGQAYTQDDLTFREQREIRKLLRELNDDPHFDPADAYDADFLPAFVYVIKRRTDPEYSMDKALELKITDLAKPEKKARPTKAGS